MTRLVISSAVALLTAYIGLAMHRIYALRVRLLEDYIAFLDRLIVELSYSRSPLIEVIDDAMEVSHKEFVEILSIYRDYIQDGREMSITSKYIKDEDRTIIQNCLSDIGRRDVDTEIISLKNNKIKGVEMLDTAKNTLKVKGELVSKLCILLGIALMILMV